MEIMYLYLLLGIAALIILVLAGVILHLRSKLNANKTILVRYINENIEMKEKLPEYETPNFIKTEEITPNEFSRIITNLMKRMLFIA